MQSHSLGHHASLLLATLIEPHQNWLAGRNSYAIALNLSFADLLHYQEIQKREVQYGHVSQGIF
jgi:hypothetical protein